MSEIDHGRLIRNWWGETLADRQTGAARALGARLRRGRDVEILCEPAVQRLAAALGTRDGRRLAALVRVLAELRAPAQAALPRLMGSGEPPALSRARFQALMRAEGEDLTQRLIRAIRGLGPADARACAIGALGRDLWLWNDQVRARWSFDYFGAPVPDRLDPGRSVPAAPPSLSEETDA